MIIIIIIIITIIIIQTIHSKSLFFEKLQVLPWEEFQRIKE